MSLLMHNTMRITDGHLNGFRAAIVRAVAFVEQHGPQLMVQVSRSVVPLMTGFVRPLRQDAGPGPG